MVDEAEEGTEAETEEHRCLWICEASAPLDQSTIKIAHSPSEVDANKCRKRMSPIPVRLRQCILYPSHFISGLPFKIPA